MLFAKVPIDPGVELILIVGLGGRSHKVVRVRDVGRWVVLQNLFGDRIEAITRNRVIHELRARRTQRIENRLRKDALPLRQSWHHAEARNAGSQPGALPVGEEESFVRLDRSPQRQSVLVSPELWLGARLCKEVSRVQRLIAEKFEQSAVELIAAGFSNHHDGAAVR